MLWESNYTEYVLPLTNYVDYFNSLFTTQLIVDECNPLIHLENI